MVETLYPLITTTVEFISALEHTNATLNTGVPPATLLKPVLLLMSFASFALSAWLWHDHPFDTSPLSNLLFLG
jgi:hypothetical protein